MSKIADAHAEPTKDFFIDVITRDIDLEDCILDLLDNSLDGAHKIATRSRPHDSPKPYEGFRAQIIMDEGRFFISDNCGGIALSDAIDYAFHFGRRSDAPSSGDLSIGIYGIGMKRAIFKLGKKISIHTSTDTESFRCGIVVDEWRTRKSWDFDLDEAPKIPGTGTRIEVTELRPEIAAEIGDIIFETRLKALIARDYALFIEKGFHVSVNDTSIRGFNYTIKEGASFQPFRRAYDDDGVRVEILAGMADAPPDSTDPEEVGRDPAHSGWYVVCNDRVVLPADKSRRTVWGDEGFPNWHLQYNGFLGMVMFQSSNLGKLPWNTTKRGIDETSPIYRRAVQVMKEATQPWLKYTNQRKADLEQAKSVEATIKSVPLFTVRQNPTFSVPVPAKPSVPMANINYQRPRSEVRRVASALGNPNMNYRAVGMGTFDYFLKNEIGEE